MGPPRTPTPETMMLMIESKLELLMRRLVRPRAESLRGFWSPTSAPKRDSCSTNVVTLQSKVELRLWSNSSTPESVFGCGSSKSRSPHPTPAIPQVSRHYL